MLTRIYVDNFRCLTNFECQLGARQLVVGRNGTGKSTMFDVLSLLRDFCVRGEAPDDRFMGRTRTRWQDVRTQTFELEVSRKGETYQLHLEVDCGAVPSALRVVKEEVTFLGLPIFRFEDGEVHLFNDRFEDKVQYPFDWHRSALATVTECRDNVKLSWFKRWLGGVLVVSPDLAGCQASRRGRSRARTNTWPTLGTGIVICVWKQRTSSTSTTFVRSSAAL